MNTKIKIITVLVVTLIIGMILGAVLHGAYMRNHFKKSVHRMRTFEGFIKRYEKIIEPTESQKPDFEKILLNTYEKIQANSKKTYENYSTIMDSLKIKLEPILTEEQKTRLETYFDKRGKYSRERSKKGDSENDRK